MQEYVGACALGAGVGTKRGGGKGKMYATHIVKYLRLNGNLVDHPTKRRDVGQSDVKREEGTGVVHATVLAPVGLPWH